MAKDPRKASAFDSGMRGKEKAKEGGDSSSRQKPGGKVGNPGGEAYSSGMRGSERPKETPAENTGATQTTGNAGGAGSSRQAPGSSVGTPGGQDTSKTVSQAMTDQQAQAATTGVHRPEATTEQASQGMDPSFEEDDTHVHIRVPKTSFKRKGA